MAAASCWAVTLFMAKGPTEELRRRARRESDIAARAGSAAWSGCRGLNPMNVAVWLRAALPSYGKARPVTETPKPSRR